MQSYILSLLGIVLVSVLIEIILPSGQTAKYIKSIFSIFVVYVLINPIVVMLRKDFDLSNYVNQGNIEINETLLKNIYKDQIEAKAKDIEDRLEDEGYQGAKVTIVYKIVANSIVLEKVTINLDNLVITSPNTNINKYQHIRQVVAQSVAIDEEDILFE